MYSKRDPFVFPYLTYGLDESNSAQKFMYKPPNNTGTVIGIIRGVIATVGDSLATIGAIIQLNTDVQSDFQSQVDDTKSSCGRGIKIPGVGQIHELVIL